MDPHSLWPEQGQNLRESQTQLPVSTFTRKNSWTGNRNTNMFRAAGVRSFWKHTGFSFCQTLASLTDNGCPAPFYRQPTGGGRKTK